MTPRPRTDTSRYEPTSYEGIWKHRSSGNFYLRDTVFDLEMRPHWIDRSLKTKEIRTALERAKLVRAKHMRGEEKKSERHTFDEAFDLVLKIQGTKGGGTPGQAYAIIDGHLRPWFKIHCPYLSGRTERYKDGFEKQFEEIWADYSTEASARKVPAYLTLPSQIEDWKKENAAPRKLEHDRRYLIMTLKRAHNRGWQSKRFTKTDFPLNEVSEPIGQYIEHEDAIRLLGAAKAYPKLYLQIRMALETGMRISEILHLNKDEVDLKRREIDLNPKRVKTRRRREVPIPIPDDLFRLVSKAYREAPGPYLFPAERHTIGDVQTIPDQPQDDNSFHWNKARQASGVQARFHDLRHTAITNMVKSGYPETMIRKVCGVSEGTMRRIYAHLERELKDRFRVLFQGQYNGDGG